MAPSSPLRRRRRSSHCNKRAQRAGATEGPSPPPQGEVCATRVARVVDEENIDEKYRNHRGLRTGVRCFLPSQYLDNGGGYQRRKARLEGDWVEAFPKVEFSISARFPSSRYWLRKNYRTRTPVRRPLRLRYSIILYCCCCSRCPPPALLCQDPTRCREVFKSIPFAVNWVDAYKSYDGRLWARDFRPSFAGFGAGVCID